MRRLAVVVALVLQVGTAHAALVEITATGQMEERTFPGAEGGDLEGFVPFDLSILVDTAVPDEAPVANSRGIFPGAVRVVRASLADRTLVFRESENVVNTRDRFNGYINDEELLISGFGLVDVFEGSTKLGTQYGEFTLSLRNAPEPGEGDLLASKRLEDLPQLEDGWQTFLVELVIGDHLALNILGPATQFQANSLGAGTTLEGLSVEVVPEPGVGGMLLIAAGIGMAVLAVVRRPRPREDEA